MYMSHINEYEYENEALIDSKLLCAICLHPFHQPNITSCEHIFCRYCIDVWYKKSETCPLCRQVCKKKQLQAVKNPVILRTIDQLPVKCLLCQQTGIKRKDIDDHLDQECSKVIVSCSKHETKCLWKGKREDLQAHQLICSYQPNRTKLFPQNKENTIQSNFHRLRIKNLISRHSKNSQITLRNQKLTDADMSVVVRSAIVNKQCKILDLGNNQIISYGIIQLTESLQNNTTLKMLSLHQNSISELGIQYLANKLALNTSSLKWLDLESTDLTDRSAGYLALMLTTNRTITGLWLSNNNIGYHGLVMLTSVLARSNTTLRYLDLENNPAIDDCSLDCLMDMIKHNQSLKTIYLNNCQLSIASTSKLRDLAITKQHFCLFL